MNIDSITNYPLGDTHLSKPKLKHGSNYEMCENLSVGNNSKKLNRGYYSGSFTGLNGAATKAINNNAKKFTKTFDKILKLCDDHTVIAQNLVALILAVGLRPIAIMSLPSKKEDQKNKTYAAGHAIASGLIGFAFSTAVMYPLGIAAKKVREKSAKFLNEQKVQKIYKATAKEISHSKSFGNVSRALDMAVDVFLFGILKAKLTIALIPPILKYGFGIEKNKKQNEPVYLAKTNTKSAPSMKGLMGVIKAQNQPELNKFLGGNK